MSQTINPANVQPTEDRLLIQPQVAEAKTAGGILLPEDAQEKPQMGTILKAGLGTTDKPMNFKEGQRVLYRKYNSGAEIKCGDTTCLIVPSSDVLAIIA